MRVKGFVILLAACLPMIGTAATIEKPIYGKFGGIPLDESPIISHMLFGTLPDGSPTPARIDEHTVRVVLSNVLGTGLFGVEDVDCSKGTKLTVGIGVWGNIGPSPVVEKPFKLRKMHPKAVETYREACSVAGVSPDW